MKPLKPLRQASYVDMQTKNLSTTILMWCDERNNLMWPGESSFSEWIGGEEGATWVSAANTIEALDVSVLSSGTDSFYGHDIEVGIEASLVHVGNSSFRGSFQLYRLNDDGSAGALAARVTSIGVCVERGTLRPLPLPNREELLQHCVPEPEPRAAVPQQHSQRPADAYVWATAVRQTECDDLGHLNNTRYAMYAEDALGAAVYHSAFTPDITALAEQPLSSLHISYIHEVKPYEPLFLAVWYDQDQHSFVIEMRAGEGGADADGGTLASVVVLGVAAVGDGRAAAGATPRL